MNNKTNYYTIQSIAKTFEVIETMAIRSQWELADLSRQTKLPKTTVHRILLTLEEMGYVTQEKEREHYVLTFKLVSLGSRILNNIDFIEIVQPYCQKLRDLLDETVNLCILSGTKMLVLHRQPSRQLLRPDTIVGTSFSCFDSASGKAYMAFLEEDELSALLEKIRIDSNGKIGNRNIRDIRKELKSVRETCLGYDYGEVYVGVRCIASPIFDRYKRVIATVGISVPSVRLQDENLHEMSTSVRNTAEQVSKRLGAPCYPVSIEHEST
jgi:DNA-binding IclR family transcriptional regulator